MHTCYQKHVIFASRKSLLSLEVVSYRLAKVPSRTITLSLGHLSWGTLWLLHFSRTLDTQALIEVAMSHRLAERRNNRM